MSEQSPIPIRYCDEHLLIVSKPGGMLVHRTEMSAEREVLLTRLRDQVGRHLYPIHRLDRATSGLILFGLSSESARLFHDQLRQPSTAKIYLGVCRGECPPSFTSDRPLTNHRTKTQQSAHSEFKTLETDRGFSAIEARIKTGRRHQIRRHLAHLRSQLIGDTSYGKGRINRWLREEFDLPRLFLHAAKVSLQHPIENQELSVTDPLPEDLRTFAQRFSPRLAEALLNHSDQSSLTESES